MSQSEFEAEQYQMENLSYLSPEEREKHKATAQVTVGEGCASCVKFAVLPYTALQPGMDSRRTTSSRAIFQLQIAFMYQKPPGMDAVEKAAAAKVSLSSVLRLPALLVHATQAQRLHRASKHDSHRPHRKRQRRQVEAVGAAMPPKGGRAGQGRGRLRPAAMCRTCWAPLLPWAR